MSARNEISRIQIDYVSYQERSLSASRYTAYVYREDDSRMYTFHGGRSLRSLRRLVEALEAEGFSRSEARFDPCPGFSHARTSQVFTREAPPLDFYFERLKQF